MMLMDVLNTLVQWTCDDSKLIYFHLFMSMYDMRTYIQQYIIHLRQPLMYCADELICVIVIVLMMN